VTSSLTTFKRDGTPVSRPVWCAGDDGRHVLRAIRRRPPERSVELAITTR
jgi:hypothetical protein